MCDLCYNSYPEEDFYSLSCGHAFCKQDTEEYLQIGINTGKVLNISCMQGGCDQEFKEKNVEDCVDNDLFIKYKQFLRNIMVDLDPNLRWCPSKSCTGVVKKPLNKNQTEGTCEDCNAKLCFSCSQKAHPGRGCGESEEQKLFDQWKRESGAVDCPKCTITVYKYEGCNHMTCSKCRYEFCLYDLQKADYKENHFRKALFPCVCGQFGTFSKEHLYSGLERQRKCVPLMWLKFWMAYAFKINIFWKCVVCWLLALPLTFVIVPLFFALYILTLPFCWCKLQRQANGNLLRVRKEHGLETKVSCFGCCLSYSSRGY